MIETPRSINLILEYGGDEGLRRIKINEKTTKRIISQILDAVNYMNS